MTQLKEIKMVRLNTGEDIVASCIVDEETDSVVLDSPMKVVVSRSQHTKQTLLLLMPWLPIELVEENSICVGLENVTAFMQPKSSLVEYYMNMLEVYEKILNDNDEDTLFDDPTEEEIEEEVEDYLDDEIDKMHNYGSSKQSKTKLH